MEHDLQDAIASLLGNQQRLFGRARVTELVCTLLLKELAAHSPAQAHAICDQVKFALAQETQRPSEDADGPAQEVAQQLLDEMYRTMNARA